MNKKGLATPIIIIIGVVLLLTVVILVAGSNGGGSDGKSKIVCDVHIYDSTFGDPSISSYSCYREKGCLFQMNPLGIYNEGTLKMQMGSAVATKRYETFAVTGDQDLSLSICTDLTSGTLKLTDEDANVLETKYFEVLE